jgi:hypothetical protein
MSVTFTPNERVLCYHGPLIYEAKILKAEAWDESNTRFGGIGPHFFVHYKGWKQTYVHLDIHYWFTKGHRKTTDGTNGFQLHDYSN